MKPVLTTRLAERDRDEIDTYTRKRFGARQTASVRAAFRRVFASLSVLPKSGRVHPGLSAGGRVVRTRTVLGVFTLVYEDSERHGIVLRILHGARDLVAEAEGADDTDEQADGPS